MSLGLRCCKILQPFFPARLTAGRNHCANQHWSNINQPHQNFRQRLVWWISLTTYAAAFDNDLYSDFIPVAVNVGSDNNLFNASS